MTQHSSSQPDRREYYRIEESVLMSYSIVTTEDEAKNTQPADPSLDIINEFANVSAQMKTALGRIAERSPDVASCLKNLDTKINLLSQVMLMNNEEQTLTRHNINISAGGLAFSSQKDINEGTLLRLKLLLPPDLSLMMQKGKVVSCIRQDNLEHPFQISVEFMDLSDSNQDAIARHIMRLQAQQLRQRKEQLN